MIANEFDDCAPPWAMVNVVKLLSMAFIVAIGSYLTDKESYRIFFIVAIIATVAF